MVDLRPRTEPYEVALPYGVTVTARPLTTAGMATAEAAARRAVEALKRQARERTEASLELGTGCLTFPPRAGATAFIRRS